MALITNKKGTFWDGYLDSGNYRIQGTAKAVGTALSNYGVTINKLVDSAPTDYVENVNYDTVNGYNYNIAAAFLSNKSDIDAALAAFETAIEAEFTA